MLFLSLNLVQVQGYSQFQAGLTFLPFTVLMISIARFAGSLADRYGPRLFLIVGPALTGTGFLILSLIKQTNGPADYWKTFFPGVLVVGFGMSLTVAPLTAAVMGSVSEAHAGTVSGVNNAMTRISNVFANAIFGALAVLLFSSALKENIKPLQLDVKEKQSIMAEAVNLGNAKVPAHIDTAHATVIEKSFHAGFIYAYSRILHLSAYLGFFGALMSVIFIRNKAVKKLAVSD